MKNIVILFLIFVFVSAGLFAWWVGYLRKAHSSFENYYKFRGCIELLSKTKDSGVCKLNSGKTIKLVKFNNRWYLDGDLPVCWHGLCF